MVTRASPEEYFADLEVTLTVDSYPIKVPFKINGVERFTPYAEKALKSYAKTLTVYPEVEFEGRRYVFDSWDDGVKAVSRTADLAAKTAYVMKYVLAPAPPSPAPSVEQKPLEAKQPPQPAQPTSSLQPTVTRLQETTANYTPLIIMAILVFGLTICYLAYLSRRS
jgi:hypothetical protein